MTDFKLMRAVGVVVVLAALTGLSTAGASTPVLAPVATRACEPVSWPGIADFQLVRIRATGVSCTLARRVVRGARLHERWRKLGFGCKATGYEPEVRTFYRCANGPGRVITFQTG